MNAPALADEVSGALALRAWALSLLGGHAAAGSPPASGPRAWAAFLRAERCAAPLRVRLAAAGVHLPPPAARQLAGQATLETQRFLSLGAQMRNAGSLLRARGWPGVALKGAAHAAGGGEPLDVSDLDLLVRPEHAAALAADLEDKAGYRRVGADPGATKTGTWEMAGRIVGGGLVVEVHFGIPFLGQGVSPWEGILPTDIPGIWRLDPAVHLWHLLVHSAVHHLERRGQIRELLLAGAAADACTPAQLDAVHARAAAHGAGPALLGVLHMAQGLRAGRPVADAFRGMAAARAALLLAGMPRLPAGGASREYARSVAALAAGGGEYARLWLRGEGSVFHSPANRGDTALDRRAPALAWAARTAVRAGRLAVGLVPALRLHLAVRPALRRTPPAG